ncbi:MAG: thioesterase domain-containing protein [Ktedonobacteraceae bacterium]
MHDYTYYMQALQATLDHKIPITREIGIRVAHYDGEQLALAAPIARNINHKATAFAGSLNAVMTLAGWGMIWILLKELDMKGTIVIQDSASHYKRPVTRDFTAICCKPGVEHVQQFARTLRERGRARLELQATIHENDVLVMSFEGRYVVLSNMRDAKSV